eukprot:gene9040-16162_t
MSAFSPEKAALHHLFQLFCSELTCTLCGNLYSNPYTVGPCNHSFCRDCVISTIEGKGITASQCPECGQPAWKKDLTHNCKLEGIVEQVAATQKMLLARKAYPPTQDASGPKIHAPHASAANQKIQPPLPASLPTSAKSAPAQSSGKRRSKGKRRRVSCLEEKELNPNQANPYQANPNQANRQRDGMDVDVAAGAEHRPCDDSGSKGSNKPDGGLAGGAYQAGHVGRAADVGQAVDRSLTKGLSAHRGPGEQRTADRGSGSAVPPAGQAVAMGSEPVGLVPSAGQAAAMGPEPVGPVPPAGEAAAQSGREEVSGEGSTHVVPATSTDEPTAQAVPPTSTDEPTAQALPAASTEETLAEAGPTTSADKAVPATSADKSPNHALPAARTEETLAEAGPATSPDEAVPATSADKSPNHALPAACTEETLAEAGPATSPDETPDQAHPAASDIDLSLQAVAATFAEEEHCFQEDSVLAADRLQWVLKTVLELSPLFLVLQTIVDDVGFARMHSVGGTDAGGVNYPAGIVADALANAAAGGPERILHDVQEVAEIPAKAEASGQLDGRSMATDLDTVNNMSPYSRLQSQLAACIQEGGGATTAATATAINNINEDAIPVARNSMSYHMMERDVNSNELPRADDGYDVSFDAGHARSG